MSHMNHITVYFASVVALLSTFSMPASKIPAHDKKIVIAWSKGGGAHKSMLDALTTYLQDRYTIVPLNPFETIWSIDDVSREGGILVSTAMSLASSVGVDLSDGEEAYNHLLKKDAIALINQFFSFNLKSVIRNTEEIERRIRAFLSKEKPHLVISVIPVFNYALNEAAHAHKIPFLMIPPDFDTSAYFGSLKPSKSLLSILPYNHDAIIQKAASTGINRDQIKGFGFPLREDFFATKDAAKLRKEFKIAENKKIVMILMGAAGSKKVKDYVDWLTAYDQPIHILACIGGNESIRTALEEKTLPPHVSLSVIGKTQRISDFMAIADVIITKSGPTTLCESIESKLPLIIDGTSQALDWEKFHREFVKMNKLGMVISKSSELVPALRSLLTDKNIRQDIQQKMSALSNRDFKKTIIKIIDELTGIEIKKGTCAHGICV